MAYFSSKSLYGRLTQNYIHCFLISAWPCGLAMQVQLEVHFGDVGRPAAVFLEPWSLADAKRLEVQQYSPPGEACLLERA